MSENKLNFFVWENLISIFQDPEQVKEITEDTTKPYIEAELEHLEEEIEKTKKGRKRLFQLVSLSDDLDLEEIKEQIRELQLKEKTLQDKYNQLEKENKPNTSENSVLALENAIEKYLVKKEEELTIEDKQVIIRTAIKEVIVIDKDTIHMEIF